MIRVGLDRNRTVLRNSGNFTPRAFARQAARHPTPKPSDGRAYGSIAPLWVRVTYSLDEATVRRIRRTAERLGKPQSMSSATP